MGEFELIRRYFQRTGSHPADVVLGMGDDGALLAPAPGMHLVVATDMLVEGRHFLSTVDPAALGHKALAVNLSDLAAMGAQPLGFTLALALPQAHDAWLEGFSRGMFALADAHACPLVGGDTTSGPLNLCITVLGQVPQGQALRRDGARAGDDVYVSGVLGEARLALEAFRGTVDLEPAAFRRVRDRLERPVPRLTLGMALRGVASAAADVSDGLSADLGHILEASGVSAELPLQALMDSAAVSDDVRTQATAFARHCVLAGGDDYELVFTAPEQARAAVAEAARASATPVTRIGSVVPSREDGHRPRWLGTGGQPLPDTWAGFDHFA